MSNCWYVERMLNCWYVENVENFHKTFKNSKCQKKLHFIVLKINSLHSVHLAFHVMISQCVNSTRRHQLTLDIANHVLPPYDMWNDSRSDDICSGDFQCDSTIKYYHDSLTLTRVTVDIGALSESTTYHNNFHTGCSL